MNKNNSIQIELWTECNNFCSFCYLGEHNKFTSDDIKIHVLNETIKKLSDESIYEIYDTVAFIGGEFFQGQLKNPIVKNKFFELMELVSNLMKKNIIKTCWLSATLTIGDQKDLYDVLKIFFDKMNFDVNSSEGMWIITSFDTIGRFHTDKMLNTWKFHMKNIKENFPTIKFNTCTILTGDLIEKYLNNEFSFSNFMKEYSTNFFFKQPAPGSMGDNMDLISAKKYVQKKIWNFFPERKKFISFLNKFKNENFELYDKLYNIKYRADDLYRNFDKNHLMTLNHRNKNSIKETNVEKESAQNTCGHLLSYAAYIDSNKCMICDKNMME